MKKLLLASVIAIASAAAMIGPANSGRLEFGTARTMANITATGLTTIGTILLPALHALPRRVCEALAHHQRVYEAIRVCRY